MIRLTDTVYLGQATMPVTVDDELSTSSTNPVQNKVIAQKIAEIELYKTPNVSIEGSPTITQGNISGFSNANYLQFPFALDLNEATSISIIMDFTTGADVTTQQNILDSYYGVAFAIISGKFVVSFGSNGSSWDIANGTSGTFSVEANTAYKVRLSWDGTNYVLSYSTDDGDTWSDDITVVSSLVLHETQVFIGGSPDIFGAGTAKPFGGTVNLNKWLIIYNGQQFWQGMDDSGLATRANVDLSNLSDTGKNYVHRFATPTQIGGILSSFDPATGTWTVTTEDVVIGS
jgi:hypothetical protein